MSKSTTTSSNKITWESFKIRFKRTSDTNSMQKPLTSRQQKRQDHRANTPNDTSFPEFADYRFYRFEVLHVCISLIVIVWQLVNLITCDFMGIIAGTQPSGVLPGTQEDYTNAGWLFTQFTWWTNILITFIQLYRIQLRKSKLNSKIKEFFLCKAWYVNWTSYIIIVGLLFFAGQFLQFIKGESDGYIYFENDDTPQFYLNYIVVSLIATTTFVHLLNPLSYLGSFIYLLWKGHFNFSDKEILTFKKINKLTLYGVIYPTVYMAFYLVFAYFAYDPYPVSNIKQNKGWWIAGVVPFVFYGLIFFLWFLIKVRSEREYKKQHLGKNKIVNI